MRFLLSFIFTLSLSSVFSQWGNNYIKLSDEITTENRNITGFDKIDVSEDFEVYIRYSDTAEKVEIESNENLHDLIQVEKDGETLRIYTDSYSTSSGGRRGGAKERLVAYITVTNLSEIRGNEDVIIVLENEIHTDELTIKLNEDSTLEGHIEVKDLVIQLNEDSILDIKGSADNMKVDANEDSILNGLNFIVDQLVIQLNEDSKAKLTVNGEIDLRAREDSYFYYKGEGSFSRKRLTGDSEIRSW